MDTSVSLHVIDYVLIAAVLLISLGIGVLFAVKDYKRASRVEYLLGGRRMSTLPVAFSILATFTSGISLIGLTTDVYSFGAMPVTINLGMCLTYLVSAFTFVPLMYPLRLTSLYEYLQMRFDSTLVRTLAVIIGMLHMLCYMAVALLSPAVVLQTAVNLPIWMSVGAVGLIGTVYTAIGGIKSVVWTDVFQLMTMLCCVLTVIIKGCLIVGGGTAVWDTVRAGGRASFDNFNPDPRIRTTWWGTVIGIGVAGLGTVSNQSTLQRISGVKSMPQARNAMLLCAAMYIINGFLLLAMGWVTYAYFVTVRCDPLEAGIIESRNQIPPYYVMVAMSDLPGIGGMYLAMIFSGTLSTLSSGINALAAITVEDIVKKPIEKLSESTATVITKALVVVYGVLIVGLAMGASSLDIPLYQMSTTSGNGWNGPMIGIFLLAALVPWANKYGAAAGGLAGLIFNMWIVIGNQLHGRRTQPLPGAPTDQCFIESANGFTNESLYNLVSDNRTSLSPVNNSTIVSQISNASSFFMYDISFEWYSVTGISMCLLVGITVSYLTRNLPQSHPSRSLLFPFIRKYCKQDSADLTVKVPPEQVAEEMMETPASKMIKVKT